jgi:phosphohistidine phosphatase
VGAYRRAFSAFPDAAVKRGDARGHHPRLAFRRATRRLILLRHGKSAWPDDVEDLERPLAKRGRAAAKRMGRYLAAQDLVPDAVLVSPARRAQETWHLAKRHLDERSSETDPRIYESAPETILAAVRDTADHIRSLLLVGHNPGLQELARLLTMEATGPTRMPWGEKFPTAGLAVIDLHVVAWSEVSPGRGSLERFVTPRSLEEEEDR